MAPTSCERTQHHLFVLGHPAIGLQLRRKSGRTAGSRRQQAGIGRAGRADTVATGCRHDGRQQGIEA
jgi:hypothetical protein